MQPSTSKFSPSTVTSQLLCLCCLLKTIHLPSLYHPQCPTFYPNSSLPLPEGPADIAWTVSAVTFSISFHVINVMCHITPQLLSLILLLFILHLRLLLLFLRLLVLLRLHKFLFFRLRNVLMAVSLHASNIHSCFPDCLTMLCRMFNIGVAQ